MTVLAPPAFTLPVRVYIEDTDAGGIVYHARYLHFMERVRTEWLREHDLTQHALLAQGIGLVVSRLSCRYIQPARLDDHLEASATVTALTHCSATFEQKIIREGNTLLEARVDIACIDAERLKPVRWPAPLRAALSRDIAAPDERNA